MDPLGQLFLELTVGVLRAILAAPLSLLVGKERARIWADRILWAFAIALLVALLAVGVYMVLLLARPGR